MTPGRAPFVLLLVSLCLALGAVQVGLVLRNRELTARVAELSSRVQAAERPPGEALEGRPFPSRTLLDAEGREVGLTAIPESHHTLLLVSSLACDYCELAAPRWDRVARSLAGSPVRVLGLVLDAAPAELGAADGPYPLLAPAGDAAALARRLPGVPAALLIDSEGRVLRAVLGAEQAGLDALVEPFAQ